MAVSYQLVIDCSSPEQLARFWAEALHYVIAPPPNGFDSWDDFFRSIVFPRTSLAVAPTAGRRWTPDASGWNLRRRG